MCVLKLQNAGEDVWLSMVHVLVPLIRTLGNCTSGTIILTATHNTTASICTNKNIPLHVYMLVNQYIPYAVCYVVCNG